MRILVVGAGGLLGSAVVDVLTGAGHEVVGLSRRTDPPVDLTDLASVDAALAAVGPVDGVACVAAAVPMGDVLGLADDEVAGAVAAKLWGQVGLVRKVVPRLSAGGTVVVTSGGIPSGLAGTALGALVNAGLDAFVEALRADLPAGVRVVAVRPGWIRETAESLGQDAPDALPAGEVARAYLTALTDPHVPSVLVPR